MQQDSDFLAAEAKILAVHQRLATSGARCAHIFTLGDTVNLVVPQLAEDIPGQAPHMNAGNSDVDAILYRWNDGRFVEHGRLPSPGGEDALCFNNGEGTYLAFANLRTGSGPYQPNTTSLIYREVDGEWTLDETVPTFAAKQWHHFSLDGREFLALAQGLTLPHLSPEGHGRSVLFERINGKWIEFQVLGGRWGYNWCDFEIDGHHFLAYADHISPSLIYRWDGASFVPYQSFAEQTGRSFLHFRRDGSDWLAFAAIGGVSTLYRWNGELFVAHQSLGGAGGREFELIDSDHGLFLVRICFIEGTPADPKTTLTSQLFKWADGKFELIEEFPTFGGTDASHFRADGRDYLVVSDSLTPDVRYRQDMVIYELSLDRA
ncbi:MAG: hypothetical protein P0Y59_11755 [Candidatus Sphingomonas phytovorans]|nr:hypothetical protein [Sphingomonas sp.]WEK02322.1 MAG: hypothetical protein P0Y59_11755 [Sphingomonas sp.]